MRVVPVPATLDYRALDELFGSAGEAEDDRRALLDARRVRWVDPVGMIGLLSLARVLGQGGGGKPRLQPPESPEVTGYLARMGFFEAAAAVADVDGPSRRASGRSDVLLEITPISENHDVHAVVDRVQSRAGAILSRTLHYPPSAVVQFAVILSEVCQNILEHADAPGWVAAQSYNWSRRLGRHVLVLGVGDLGRGFRGSLSEEHSGRFGDRWGDAAALEAAFIHGLTRFPDQGRGQGIQQIRKQVRRWDGAVSVRSGTARITDVPGWLDLPPLEQGIPPFAGSQITLLLPERLPEDG